MKNATDVSASVQGRAPERGPALEAGAVLIGGRDTLGFAFHWVSFHGVCLHLRGLLIACRRSHPQGAAEPCSRLPAGDPRDEFNSRAAHRGFPAARGGAGLSCVGGPTAGVGVAALSRANTASSRRRMRLCMYSHGSGSIASDRLLITRQIRVHRLLSGSFTDVSFNQLRDGFASDKARRSGHQNQGFLHHSRFL